MLQWEITNTFKIQSQQRKDKNHVEISELKILYNQNKRTTEGLTSRREMKVSKFKVRTQKLPNLNKMKRPWCWERLRAGGEGDNRGWDGWMASPTWSTWVWVDSGSWWWTGRPGVLWFIGSQRVGHNWVTERNWTKLPSKQRKTDLLKWQSLRDQTKNLKYH